MQSLQVSASAHKFWPNEDAGIHKSGQAFTVQPLYNKGPRNWQNVFALMGFCCVEVLFYRFGKEYSFVELRNLLKRLVK